MKDRDGTNAGHTNARANFADAPEKPQQRRG